VARAQQADQRADNPKDDAAGPRWGGGSGGGGELAKLNPFRLAANLPETHRGWAAADQAKWLQTAANISDLIYKGEDGIEKKSSNETALSATTRKLKVGGWHYMGS
jgi:hypothetical protein